MDRIVPAPPVEAASATAEVTKASRFRRLGGISLRGAEVQTTPEAARDTKVRRLGRGMLTAAKVEGVGLIVDGGLMAAGVDNIVKRETLASIGDVFAFKKFSKHGKHGAQTSQETSKLRKAGKATRDLVAGAAVAVTSAKIGVNIAEHVDGGLGEGATGAAVLLGSKLAGLNAYGAVRSRHAARKAQKASMPTPAPVQ